MYKLYNNKLHYLPFPGPCSHLIRGVFEQNYIAHVMSYAGCMGPSAKFNPACSEQCRRNYKLCSRSSASGVNSSIVFVLLIPVIRIILDSQLIS